MSGGWVAASVRARGLARRRLGPGAATSLAASPSLADALGILDSSSYGRELHSTMDLATAQHGVSAALLWHLRILAGWAPALGSESMRLLTGGFEIANVTGALARLEGRRGQAPFELGSMAVAWPVVREARTAGDVRAALRASPWGDPGSEDGAAVRVALQIAWARQVHDGVPGVAPWAQRAAALVLARVLAANGQGALAPTTRAHLDYLLGRRWVNATSAGDMTEPVTSQTERFVRCLWSLDRDLAYARHYPAVSWRASFSRDATVVGAWHAAAGRPAWAPDRARAQALLAQGDRLAPMVELVGLAALPSRERVAVLAGRLLREGVLQQSALSENDASCSPEKQAALLDMVLSVYDCCLELVDRGVAAERLEAFDFSGLIRASDDLGSRDASGVVARRDEILAALGALT